jgi:diaminopimelate decarboxylase
MDDLTKLIQEHNMKIFNQDEDVFDIISSILEGNVSEEAFFIVDIGKVIRQYERWVQGMPTVKPYYAVKCNPNPVIIKVLSDLGCNFDCASKNEIAGVLSIMDSPERIVFANPCKMSGQIKYARAVDVDTMTFDSDHELYKIKLYHPNANLLVRIKVDDTGSKCRFSCKFGCPMDEVDNLLNIAKTLSLKIVGVSFHVGSGCTDPNKYSNAVENAKSVIDKCTEMGFAADIIDIGGGFEDSTFDDISKVVNEYTSKYRDIKWIAEPGRFMVNNSHTLVVNVIGKKKIGDQDFVYYLNDGVYGSFNCIYFDHALPEVCPFNERNGPRYKSIIFGPTCDSLDKISDNVMLPEMAIGEWCYIEKFGAYTTAAASTFNGFQQTQVIYVITN